MYKVKEKLKELGYTASHPEYWILKLPYGLDLWIKVGRKAKSMDRVRDWFVRPPEVDSKFRNYDCLKDAIDLIKEHVEILNKLED